MRRLVRLTAWVLGLTLLLSACGDHKTVETADVGVQTAPPAEGVTALTLCDGDVTLRFEKVENAAWVWQDTYQRRIPDGLVWGYSDAVPSEDDPIYHRGEG